MIACEEDSYVDYLQRPLVFGVAARNGVRHEGLQVLQPAPFSILTADIAPNSRARAFSKYNGLSPDLVEIKPLPERVWIFRSISRRMIDGIPNPPDKEARR